MNNLLRLLSRRVTMSLLVLFVTGMGITQTEQSLTFNPAHGFFGQAFYLTITAPVEPAQIKYTLNGEHPLTSREAITLDSPARIHIDPFSTSGRDVAPGVCVRAIAVVADTAITPLKTQTYLFVDQVTQLSRDNQRPGPGWPTPGGGGDRQMMDYGMDPQVYNDSRYSDKIIPALLEVPTLSMTLDLDDLFDPNTGIYMNAVEHGREWERQCSLELLNPDGSEGFHINCGVRIRGGWSRQNSNPKHAFRFFFRGEYGDTKLRYPLFEDKGTDEFDKVDLRCTQNYSWSYQGDPRNTYLRDVFSRDLQRDMGQPYTRSRYYHFYINGTYWGLFQTQERSEARYAESYFGGEHEHYDVVKVDGGYGGRPYDIEATDGNLEAWNHLWELCEQGLDTDENFYKVQGLNPDGSVNPDYPKLVDLDNLIDFMIATFFVGDFDGPLSDFRGNRDPNNFYGVYNRVTPFGFVFFRHDAEHSLWNFRGVDRTGPYPGGDRREKFNPQWLHQKLAEHPEYRMRFGDRVYTHFFSGGALTEAANVKRWLDRKDEFDLAIIAESARWGDAKSGSPLTRDEHWLPQVEWVVDEYFPTRNGIVLNQLIGKNWYSTVAPPTFNTEDAAVDKGFQLRMNAPSGTIYYTTDGSMPHNAWAHSDIQSVVLSPWHADKRVLVPSRSIPGTWRSSVNYDDSDWDLCSGSPGGIGYEKGDGYQNFITLNVARHMHEDETASPNPSCFIRIPFSIGSDVLSELSKLTLKTRFDDGLVVYLNGMRVTEMNAPDDLDWNSFATQNHEAESINTFDLSPHIDRLRAGQNVLAVQALNVSFSSSDFLFMAELSGGILESSGNLVSPTAVEYTGDITVNQTTHFKARALSNGQWSPLQEVTLAVKEDMQALKVTELHYKPLPEQNGDSVIDRDYFEFIELKNISASPLNLTAAEFIKGIAYRFPAGSELAPGEFVVLAANTDYFRQRYTLEADGQYEGNLSNGGERIVLVSAARDTILNFKYNDNSPWPEEPDSTGQSLVAKLMRPTGNPDEPSYWTVSAQVHGSPHADDLATPVAEREEHRPHRFRLYANFPNPFNPQTTLRFDVPVQGLVTLDVFNTLGQHVVTLLDKTMTSGTHRLNWDASALAGGVYFVQLRAGTTIQTIKVLLLK